jgi:hypothetical protein
MLLGHLLPPPLKIKCESTFNHLLFCVIIYTFKIWIAILKRYFWDVIAINGRKILKCILKKYNCNI